MAMDTLREYSLDYDSTFELKKATKHDGYTETDDSVTSISSEGVFGENPPITLLTIEELMEAPTPPAYLGNGQRCYIKFRNAWLAITNLLESSENRRERGRREAVAHARIQRQLAGKEAAAQSDKSISESFKILAAGVVVMGVLALLFVLVLVMVKGAPA